MHNDDVSGGVVEIIGSVNTENFGSYTYEYSTVGEPNWQTIAAGSGNRIDESLGNWYTSDLTPGPYFCVWWLDNDGREQSACVIIVQIVQN